MRAAWPTKPLGDVCRLIGGGTPSKDKPQYYGGSIPWATVRDMRSEVISTTEYAITEAAVADSATNVVPGGSVVIATRVGLGKTCLLARDTAINQDLRGVIPDDSEQVSVRFLLLKSMSEVIVAEGTGATVQGVKLPFLRSLPFPVPSIAEQHCIVAVLDEAFADIAVARANVEENLENARAVFESYLQLIFCRRGDGWLEGQLGSCVESISTGPFGSLLHKSDYEIGGISLVNPINILGSAIVPDDGKAVGKAKAAELANYALREDDIVIGRRGEIGRCAVVTRDQSGWLCGTGCFVIRPSERTDSRFLAQLLRSPTYRGRLERLAGRATMPNISNVDLAGLVVALPAMREQRAVAARIDELSDARWALVATYQRKLAALDELKQSLLHQAFTGQLTKMPEADLEAALA